MIAQLAMMHSDRKYVSSRLWYPYISIELIFHISGMERFIFDKQVVDKLETQFDQINGKITNWIKEQAIFVQILRKVIGDTVKDKSSDHKHAKYGLQEKDRLDTHLYSKYSETFAKSSIKRQEKHFSEADRAFKVEESIQKATIPWVDEWSLKFNKEFEEEINQILYFGYKDSPFYSKEENKWYQSHFDNKSISGKDDFNRALANWST